MSTVVYTASVKELNGTDDVPEQVMNDLIELIDCGATELKHDETLNGDELTPIGYDDPALKFRLRYHDYTLHLHLGNEQYDLDHRGSIGAGAVTLERCGTDSSADYVRGAIETALNELLNDKAMR
jgi:hypothetical protein